MIIAKRIPRLPGCASRLKRNAFFTTSPQNRQYTMVSRHSRAEQFELLPRSSHESTSSDDSTRDHYRHSRTKLGVASLIRPFLRLSVRPVRSVYTRLYPNRNSRGFVLRHLTWIFVVFVSLVAILVVFTYIFNPSYSHPPTHYRELQQRCRASREPGRGNINNEKVYIAATLHDPGGGLVAGEWGRVVLELVNLLGPQNVHLSIYENDADELARKALQDMGRKAECTCLAEQTPLHRITLTTYCHS